jgi:hypothetical protein
VDILGLLANMGIWQHHHLAIIISVNCKFHWNYE